MPERATRRPRRAAPRAGAAALFGGLVACAAPPLPRPEPPAAEWSVVGQPTVSARPPDAAEAPRAALAALDAALDAFDRARFGADAELRAALLAWLGLAVEPPGPRLQQRILERLLELALAIEPHAEALTAEQRALLADTIALLSADRWPPRDLEALRDRELTYRLLSERGHARIADNARWRTYDLLRWVALSVLAEPDHPDDFPVAALAILAWDDALEPWLDPAAGEHGRPPPPDPRELGARLDQALDALAEVPGWADLAAARRALDAPIREGLRERAERTPDPGGLPAVAPGVGVAMGRAPVIAVDGAGGLELDGRPWPGPGEAAPAVLALAVARTAPGPAWTALLDALRRAGTRQVGVVVAEPRVDPSAPAVTRALPLSLAVAAPPELRLRFVLGGRQTAAVIDGRIAVAVASEPEAIRATLRRVLRAFPYERSVGLERAEGLGIVQLVSVLAAIREIAGDAVEIIELGPTAAPTAGRPDPRPLERREAWLTVEVSLVGQDEPGPAPAGAPTPQAATPGPLPIDGRLTRAVQHCAMELGVTPAASAPLTVELALQDGYAVAARWSSASRRRLTLATSEAEQCLLWALAGLPVAPRGQPVLGLRVALP